MTVAPHAALSAIRVVAALMMWIHGLARLFAGGVVPFGGWLDSIGFPFGPAIAWGITAIEILAPPLLAAGFLVRPLALYFAAELMMGILLVHRHDGWFVVGLGRNGMEYSVLLIAVFLTVAAASGDRETSRP